MKCCLKTENGCLKIQTKHPLSAIFFDMFDENTLNPTCSVYDLTIGTN